MTTISLPTPTVPGRSTASGHPPSIGHGGVRRETGTREAVFMADIRRGPQADGTRRSESGFPVRPVYARTTSPPGLAGAARRAGGVPVHPRRLPTMYTAAALDDAPVRRLRHRRGVQRALPPAARAPAPRACRSPSTCRPRWATTPTTPIAHGEVGKVGVAIDSIDDMRLLFDGIPLDKVSTSMTINAPAALLLLLYQLVAEEQGVAGDSAQRHDPERRPQGVHRPRHVHLPAASRRCGWSPTSSRTAAPRSRGGTPSRSPATTWPRPARRPRRRSRSRWPTASSTSARRSRAGLDVDDFAPAAVVLLRRPHHAAGGGREVPRGPADLGPGDARRVRRQGPEVA